MPEKNTAKGLDFDTPQHQHSKGSSHLLAIGINAYAHWPTLNNAVKDVTDFAQLLKEEYAFNSAYIKIISDAEATRENIIRALSNLKRTITEDDNLIIYYSGHGHIVKGYNESRKRGFWIPVQASKDNEAHWLRNSTVREYIEDIRARHILLISDACFSGSLLQRGEMRSDFKIEELMRRRSRWGLCSGRDDQVVADGAPGTNSPFAACILDELRKNTTAHLRIGTLANRVIDRTRSNYQQLPQGAIIFGTGDEGGEFIFERKKDEALLWQQTQNTNTVEAYQRFLALFPHSRHADQARTQITALQADTQWQKIQQAPEENARQVQAKITLIENYIRQFPQCRILSSGA